MAAEFFTFGIAAFDGTARLRSSTTLSSNKPEMLLLLLLSLVVEVVEEWVASEVEEEVVAVAVAGAVTASLSEWVEEAAEVGLFACCCGVDEDGRDDAEFSVMELAEVDGAPGWPVFAAGTGSWLIK